MSFEVKWEGKLNTKPRVEMFYFSNSIWSHFNPREIICTVKVVWIFIFCLNQITLGLNAFFWYFFLSSIVNSCSTASLCECECVCIMSVILFFLILLFSLWLVRLYHFPPSLYECACIPISFFPFFKPSIANSN